MPRGSISVVMVVGALASIASAQTFESCAGANLQQLSAPCAGSGCDSCVERFDFECNAIGHTEINRNMFCEVPGFSDVRAFVRSYADLDALRVFARVTVPSGGGVGAGAGASALSTASVHMTHLIDAQDAPPGGVFVFAAVHIGGVIMTDEMGTVASADANWSVFMKVHGTIEDSIASQTGGESGTWVASYQAPIDQLFEVELEVRAGATARARLGSSASATAALERTVAWMGIVRVEDINGNELTNYTVTDPDGFDWTQSLYCPADFAPAYGVLDFDDVLEFVTLFAEQSYGADLAEPIGEFDFDDVLAFLVAFGEGCP